MRSLKHDRMVYIHHELEPNPDDLHGWLQGQAKEHGLKTLLAHAHDGIIWGFVGEDGKLALSGEVFKEVSPALRRDSLMEARLFGLDAELLLWCGEGETWHARLLRDELSEQCDTYYFDEAQWLWGERYDNRPDNGKHGFTLVNEGAEGMYHAVPMKDIKSYFDAADKNDDRWHPLRLVVRHYMRTDPKSGVVYIAQSRLVAIDKQGKKKREKETGDAA